jgi:hypothetical protein
MTLTCPCCKGERFVPVTHEEIQDAPTVLEPCCYCGATSAVPLSASEALSFLRAHAKELTDDELFD